MIKGQRKKNKEKEKPVLNGEWLCFLDQNGDDLARSHRRTCCGLRGRTRLYNRWIGFQIWEMRLWGRSSLFRDRSDPSPSPVLRQGRSSVQPLRDLGETTLSLYDRKKPPCPRLSLRSPALTVTDKLNWRSLAVNTDLSMFLTVNRNLKSEGKHPELRMGHQTRNWMVADCTVPIT